MRKRSKLPFSSLLFIVIVFFLGCAAPQYMKQTQSIMVPTEQKALVYFMRPSVAGNGVDIYDGDIFIGIIFFGCQFSYLSDPGKHLFWGVDPGGQMLFLDADIEAGKTYYVIIGSELYKATEYQEQSNFFGGFAYGLTGQTSYLTPKMKAVEVNRVRANFSPINRGNNLWDEVKKYESSLQKTEPITEALKQWEERTKKNIKNTVYQYESEWKKEFKWPKLHPEDGR